MPNVFLDGASLVESYRVTWFTWHSCAHLTKPQTLTQPNSHRQHVHRFISRFCSLLIVAGRTNFQNFLKIIYFRLDNIIVVLWICSVLEPTPLIYLERSIGRAWPRRSWVRAWASSSLYQYMNNRPPACKSEKFVTINCESCLSRLIIMIHYVIATCRATTVVDVRIYYSYMHKKCHSVTLSVATWSCTQTPWVNTRLVWPL